MRHSNHSGNSIYILFSEKENKEKARNDSCNEEVQAEDTYKLCNLWADLCHQGEVDL